jgi:hypothetical protein
MLISHTLRPCLGIWVRAIIGRQLTGNQPSTIMKKLPRKNAKSATRKAAENTAKKPTPNLGKKPPGRPSIFCQKIADKIIEQLTEGKSITSICKQSGMPGITTLWNWEQKNEQFRKDSMRAKSAGTHSLASQCLDIADDMTIDPANKRVMIDTRIRLIGKWNSKEYGDKLDVTSRDEAPPITQEWMIEKLRRSPSFLAQVEMMVAEAKSMTESKATAI